MVRHRRQPHVASTRRLLLSCRDVLALTACAVGLLSAWLIYGGSGSDGLSAMFGKVASTGGAPVVRTSEPEPLASHQGLSTPSAADSARGSSSPGPTVTSQPPLAVADAGSVHPEFPLPTASAPQRITYPGAGMDVAVHPLQPDTGGADSQSIEPPETKDGYWLAPFGAPGAGSTNTTYVIGHSWVDQDAPFNHLSSAAAPGDEFTVTTATGILSYSVESVTTYTKSALKDSPIWAVVPNRLVLISCYAEDPWGRNVIVVASRAPGR